jgi:hypothetical protein
MNQPELIIAAIATVLLLLIILIVIMVRKRIPKKVLFEKGHKFPESARETEIIKPDNKPTTLDPKPKKEPLPLEQARESSYSTEPESELVIKPQTNKTVTPSPKDSNETLPQDSMLRRHYLTNLRFMIESLKPPHPTDSSLARHYDTIITAEIEQCLRDKGAVERLICNYEDHKRTLAQQLQQPKIITEPLLKAEISPEDSVSQHEKPKLQLPEDSMLRRHTITNLYAIVESNMPIRPTDSVLRRHYDTMIKSEVDQLLDCEAL